MRNLQVYTEAEATQQLRAGENLVPAGGVTLAGYDLKFFVAASDEDFMNKDQKLNHRRRQRKVKRGKEA